MIVKSLGYQRASPGASAQMMAHIKYLLYRERGAEEPQRDLFGPNGRVANRHAAARDLSQHFGRGVAYHKLLLSPKDDERRRLDARGTEGWQEWTRTVMADLGARLGKDLHWVATKHANTAHPHIHLVVAGLGETQAGRTGTAGVRGQRREVRFSPYDFRAAEVVGRRESGVRDRADVQQQLRLFAEQDRAHLPPVRERSPEQNHERDQGRSR
ncbi:MAG: hypothetical protein H0X24_17885 [Ktedonobacterales bacterium]|nr:hypothetical protein [Ktedonobacterales bacterium]